MALIKSVRGYTPKFGKNCFLAENATVVGEVANGRKLYRLVQCSCEGRCSFHFNWRQYKHSGWGSNPRDLSKTIP